MSEQRGDAQAEPNSLAVKLKSKLKRFGIAAVIAVFIFLLGFVPMWYRSWVRTQERDAAQRELRLNQMQNSLASAAINARRGDYEPARQSASKFFSELRTESDKKDGSALTSEQMGKLAPIFAQRDDVVTLLARNDPAAADRLSDMFAAYRKALGSTAAQR